jgi:hypothetical protein
MLNCVVIAYKPKIIPAISVKVKHLGFNGTLRLSDIRWDRQAVGDLTWWPYVRAQVLLVRIQLPSYPYIMGLSYTIFGSNEH